MNLLQALEAFGKTTGDYWSQDNARFEQGNPSTIDRVVRAVNPMTGFGSALGAMSDAASKGLPPVDTGAALMQSLPLFGSVITKAGTAAAGALKAVPAKVKNDFAKTLGSAAASTAASVGVDEAQAADRSGPLGMSDVVFSQMNPLNKDSAQITPNYRVASEAQVTGWGPEKEKEFLQGIQNTKWYRDFVKDNGHAPDLSPDGDYNYRAAWQRGVRPSLYEHDGKEHWGSVAPTGESLKATNHPTAWMEDYMQLTGGKDPHDTKYTPTAGQLNSIRKAIEYRYGDQLPDSLNAFPKLIPRK